jgi:hypothetical protein
MSFKWGEFDTLIMEGTTKINPDAYQEDTPWVCVDNDSLLVCVPWQNKDGYYYEIGVKFTDIVKSYLSVLEDGLDEGVNNSDDVLVAIRDLSKVIELLSESQRNRAR